MAARLLLAHSPLTGSATRELVAAGLPGNGFDVAVPGLTGTVTAGPPYCVRQAQAIARGAVGQPAIVTGHGPYPAPLARLGRTAGPLRDINTAFTNSA
jgi:hypothetical protein